MSEPHTGLGTFQKPFLFEHRLNIGMMSPELKESLARGDTVTSAVNPLSKTSCDGLVVNITAFKEGTEGISIEHLQWRIRLAYAVPWSIQRAEIMID